MNLNPYESPQPNGPSGQEYYKLRTTRLNLRECRQISKNWYEMIVVFSLRILHVRIPMAFAHADTSLLQQISPGDISEQARGNIKPLADQALALDLNYEFSYAPPSIGKRLDVTSCRRGGMKHLSHTFDERGVFELRDVALKAARVWAP